MIILISELTNFDYHLHLHLLYLVLDNKKLIESESNRNRIELYLPIYGNLICHRDSTESGEESILKYNYYSIIIYQIHSEIFLSKYHFGCLILYD